MVRLKIKASSLIEVIVAMVIMSLSVMTGGMIYLNVIGSSHYVQEMEAELYLQQLIVKIEKEQEFVDKTYETDHFFVVTSFTPYQGKENLIQLNLTAENNQNKQLASIKKLLLIRE